MIYWDQPFLTVHWDETTACVLMEWKKFVSGAGFRNGLDKGLELIRQKKASRWLADLRKLGVVTQDDQNWSNNDWFPRAIAAGVKRMAIVVPESTLAKMSVDAIMSKVPATELTVHYFSSVDEAKKWLRAQ